MSSLYLPAFPGIDIAYSRVPMYTTNVQNSVSGREVAISYESYPRYQWSIKMNVLRNYVTNAEQKQLEAIFHLLAGRGGYFRFQDPEYWQTDAPVQLGVGTGTATQFRIGFNHYDPTSAQSFFEPVSDPRTWTVYVDGIAKTNGTDYVMDIRGLITFQPGHVPAAGAVITWAGSWWYRCRLLDDKLQQDRIVTSLWSSTIQFRSVKV